jgi:flagellar export protein FliJ
MPFKFRLKSVKRHREFILREAQAALGAAESARMRIVTEIEELLEVIRRQTDQFEQEQKNGVGAPRYIYFKDHLSSLERELLGLLKRLEKASKEVENRKNAVIERDKSVKTLDSIETRDRELYSVEQTRREQRKMDDVALMNALNGE